MARACQSPFEGLTRPPVHAKMGDVTTRDASWYGRLDRAAILDAALRIAARPGTAEVTFRDLGEELGADPTAVYRHFRNKAQLMAAVTDRLMDDVASTLPTGAGWRAVLTTMAEAALETFVAHPPIGARLVDARPVGPGELRLIEASLRAFEEAGLDGDALVEHYGAFSGMLLSYVAATCRGLVTRRSAGHDPGTMPWLESEVELTEERFPTLSVYAEQLLGLDFRSTYFAGVTVLIESVQRSASRA